MIDLVDAVSKRLDEIFKGEYAIYLENVEQGLKVPCFFVHPIYGSDRNLLSNRKYMVQEFDIMFIPEEEGRRLAFVEVSDKLFDSFDFLKLEDGSILYTFDRRIDVTDDMLHFRITFKFDYMKEVTEDQIMQDTLHNKVSVIDNGN